MFSFTIIFISILHELKTLDKLPECSFSLIDTKFQSRELKKIPQTSVEMADSRSKP